MALFIIDLGSQVSDQKLSFHQITF